MEHNLNTINNHSTFFKKKNSNEPQNNQRSNTSKNIQIPVIKQKHTPVYQPFVQDYLGEPVPEK